MVARSERGELTDEEKWAQVQDPISEGYAMFQGMLTALLCFADRLRAFRQQIALMADHYFEALKRMPGKPARLSRSFRWE